MAVALCRTASGSGSVVDAVRLSLVGRHIGVDPGHTVIEVGADNVGARLGPDGVHGDVQPSVKLRSPSYLGTMASQRRSRSSRHAKGGVVDRHGRRYRDWAQGLPHFGTGRFGRASSLREHFEPIELLFPQGGAIPGR